MKYTLDEEKESTSLLVKRTSDYSPYRLGQSNLLVSGYIAELSKLNTKPIAV